MMKWEIKQFEELTNMELYQIIKQRINIFVVEQECPYLECDGKDINSFHLFAKVQDQLIAYSRILPPGISFAEASIGRVIVNEDYRRQGIGTVLMKRAINFIENNLQEKTIRISAQEYAIDFYKNVGFRVDSNIYLEDDILHVEMIYEKNKYH
ncbi:MAG: GNAT family N-acetyltransferase [Candidatus Woesearchaeota archaeon]